MCRTCSASVFHPLAQRVSTSCDSKIFCRFDFGTEQTLYLPPCLLGHRCAYSTQRKSQLALHDQVVGADCRVELEVELLLQFLVVDF